MSVLSPSQSAVSAWRRHDPSITSPEALLAELTAGSLPQAFDAGAEAHPESVLTIGEESFTLAALAAYTRRWAGALANSGVRPGDRVLLQAATSTRMVCAYVGLLRVGAVVVLAGPALTAHELGQLLKSSEARFAVTEQPFAGAARRLDVDALARRAGSATPVTGWYPAPGDTALIAFTSGTTGRPKGVPLTHRMLLSSISAVMRAWRWRPDDMLVHALPLYHQHGLGGVHATLIGGSSARILTKFDALTLVAVIREVRATVLFAVPTIYQRLVELPGETGEAMQSLRLATSGSAPLPSALFQRVQQRLRIVPVERYGLTESGLDVSNLYEGPRRAGVVGYPLPGVEVRLTDPAGRDVSRGQDGEIVLRGPQVFDGYLDDVAATAASFYPGGWFRTGDLGRYQDDGALAITGRLKDIIVTGGINVSPVEVEEVLAAHPDVRQAAVTGIPDAQWGEAVAAWVVVARPVDVAELTAHCRHRLAAFKCPKRITTVDKLPINAMGKIQRKLLVDLV